MSCLSCRLVVPDDRQGLVQVVDRLDLSLGQLDLTPLDQVFELVDTRRSNNGRRDERFAQTPREGDLGHGHAVTLLLGDLGDLVDDCFTGFADGQTTR